MGPVGTPAPAPGEADPIAVSVVVPCYRDEAGLAELFDRLGPVMDGLGGPSELVIVDDGSPDHTAERAIELGAAFPRPVQVVRLVRNFGQHPAVFAGMEHCRGRVVVTMDSDLQYPPEEIPKLLAELDAEHGVVSGVRARRRDPWLRRLVTRALTSWFNRRTGANLEDFGSMFKAYDREVVERMLAVTERHRNVPAIVAWLGVPTKEIPVEHVARGERGSRYRLGALVGMVLDLVTGYTVFPLRAVTLLGLVGCAVGLVATLVFIVYRIVVGAGVGGVVSAFALVFFLLGVQLLIVAMIGEYVGRIYSEARARPYYIVGGVFSNDKGGEAGSPADK
jgi:undecaprenyl-phosphate 4-deoxy-4-formamido-L-arabinose transferase